MQSVLSQDLQAPKQLAAAKGLDKVVAARAYLLLNDLNKASELANQFPQDLAGYSAKAAVLDRCEKPEEAKKALESARQLAFAMDGDLPATKSLMSLCQKMGFKTWKSEAPVRKDLGKRPPLSKLGPLHWQPPTAPRWAANDMEGQQLRNGVAADQPQLLLFYLGADCTHCVDQLNAFAKHAADFMQAGITLQAISPQKPEAAIAVHAKCTSGKAFPFPLLSDPSLAAFKTFRAFDDFEGDALHAVVLIDSKQRLRWIEVGYQPFMDAPFLLREAKRLLALPADFDD